MPTPEYHAKLSPSSAARWINCPPSMRLGESIPDKSSEDAERGRLAHSIAELKARKKFFTMSKRTYTSQLNKLQANPFYEKIMDDNTDAYVEELTEHAMTFKMSPVFAPEIEVPIGLITSEKKDPAVTGKPEDADKPAGGTADCIQIGEGVLWVTDYKNGSGIPVSAEDNPQMKLYALGALALYHPFYGDSIHTVRMTIVQPALNNVSTWETTRDALEAWGRDVVAPAAALAWAGEGELKPGEWCKSHFCPIRATCRARANSALSLEEFKRSLPATLSPTETADVLRRGELLAAWYSDVKDYALDELLKGNDIPGYKVVEGRGSREWDDLDAAFADLSTRGVAEAMLWERKPVTPPALEKALGKKSFEETAGNHVVKKPGKPALAPEPDKRPPYNPALAAFGAPSNG